MDPYYIPTGAGEAELTEKRSTFLGHVRPVASEEEAREFIAAMKKEYHDARHNCWCYRLQGGPERYSDDGEPQGSAGIPMLAVFQREEVTNVVCVVTRYFGGVLLGTGGLLRAYTKSAKDALTAAGVSAVCRWVTAEAQCAYGLFERVKTAAAALGGVLPEQAAEDFQTQIRDLSAGSARVELTGEEFKAVPVSAGEGD